TDSEIQRDYDRTAEHAQDDGAEPPVQEQYNVVRDYQNEYHGSVTLEEAFTESCNTTFAKLSVMLGAARVSKTAKDMGIGKEYLFEDMMLYKSSYEKPNTQLQLAWSGIGQYKDLMTPMQMCMLAGAVANDGVMMEPKLLKNVTTHGGTVSKTLQREACDPVFSKKEAHTIKSYMRAVVEKGTGKRASLDELTVCGKTGTAEISSDKSVKTHAWFVGFIEEPEHPLAVCVILEQAGGGGSVAAPIAGKMLQKAVELGY
ncbi:MAG: penicillin-binding transpeptidase domain-containing protein, partial [Eubacteriales bacterium]|nr:penicillin-binding transpeptidase domain-containing protein [Eubacteriales bacterium]